MDLHISGIILYMRWANETLRYNVSRSLIGWVHTQNDIWIMDLHNNGILSHMTLHTRLTSQKYSI